MKVVVLYRPNSERARVIEEFVTDFQRRYNPAKLEVQDFDSRDGSATASLYDIVAQPAILVLQDNGYLQKYWEGDQLPLMDEVAAYTRA